MALAVSSRSSKNPKRRRLWPTPGCNAMEEDEEEEEEFILILRIN
jgi:hypothetical protein